MEEELMAKREAIPYRYKAVPMGIGREHVEAEPWELVDIILVDTMKEYWIFRTKDKGLAIPANKYLDKLDNPIRLEEER